MPFNSIHFLLFFPTVLVLYYLLPQRHRWALLFVASCYFYMAWRPEYIVLLLGMTGAAYVGALRMQAAVDPRRRKAWFVATLLVELGVLFVFKYVDFFNESVRDLLSVFAVPYDVPALNFILPLAISFHTFQLVAYIIDVYRGKIPAERNLGIFSVFSMFFPQLVAGPIERASNLLPQFYKNVEFDHDRVASGLKLIAWGLFKKVVIADRLAPLVTDVYGAPHNYEGPTLVFATVLFAFQVYCDFSAYSDIAIGAARALGIKLMDNFRQPYFATSISDFWKRWHISLSTWLTDYVYTPLTKAKSIKLKWYPKFLLALVLTFLVSGLWHGANWTYVVWGALHGTYLVCSMLTQNWRKRFVAASGLARVPKLHATLQVLMTFSLVCLTYVFFRAASLSDAFYIVTHLFQGWGNFFAHIGFVQKDLDRFAVDGNIANLMVAMAGMGVVLAWDAVARYGPPQLSWRATPVWMRWPAYCALLFATVMLGAFYDNAQSFIYFQF